MGFFGNCCGWSGVYNPLVGRLSKVDYSNCFVGLPTLVGMKQKEEKSLMPYTVPSENHYPTNNEVNGDETKERCIKNGILSFTTTAYGCLFCNKLWLKKYAADLCCNEMKKAIRKKVEDA
jgi:hypothetical protein